MQLHIVHTYVRMYVDARIDVNRLTYMAGVPIRHLHPCKTRVIIGVYTNGTDLECWFVYMYCQTDRSDVKTVQDTICTRTYVQNNGRNDQIVSNTL